MNAATSIAILSAFAVSAASAWVLTRWAARLAWVDAPEGTDAARKLQTHAVPTIGGAAILLGTLAGSLAISFDELALGSALDRAVSARLGVSVALGALPALVIAFLVGLVDDLFARGLSVRWKLAGQCLAGAVLAAPCVLTAPSAAGWTMAALLVFAAVAAQNAFNTFDNSDGAAGSLAVLALAWPAPIVGAAVLGFLPLNLRLFAPRSPSAADRGARAYLGDSGSHLLGLALLLAPAAWPALVLPLVDLARVVGERVLAGERPWLGDRRHLAHRLCARGHSSAQSAGVLLLVAAPSVVFGALAWRAGSSASWLTHALGPSLTLVLYVLAVLWTRGPAQPRSARVARRRAEPSSS